MRAQNTESAPETVSMSAEVQRSEGDGKAAKSSGHQRGWSQWQRSDFLTAFEFSALVVMIAVVWVLLSLPVLFYYLSSFEVGLGYKRSVTLS